MPVTPVAENHRIDQVLVLAEHRHPQRPLANENFLRNLEHPHLAILGEGDQIINGGALLRNCFPGEGCWKSRWPDRRAGKKGLMVEHC
jgi:hypothetical protein